MSKIGVEVSTYEDWHNPEVEVLPINAIEQLAWDHAIKAHGSHPNDEDARRNAMWEYVAGARAVLEEARKKAETWRAIFPASKEEEREEKRLLLSDLESLFEPQRREGGKGE